MFNRLLNSLYLMFFSFLHLNEKLPQVLVVTYTKCYLYKMLSLRNVIYAKCYLYKMLSMRNVIYAKCYLYKMLARQNVLYENEPRRKCSIQNVTDPKYLHIWKIGSIEISKLQNFQILHTLLDILGLVKSTIWKKAIFISSFIPPPPPSVKSNF